jgi:hypothetical protein
MIRCQDFFKLGTGHSVKHRCLNALSPFLAPVKAHIVASLSGTAGPLQTRETKAGKPCSDFGAQHSTGTF